MVIVREVPGASDERQRGMAGPKIAAFFGGYAVSSEGVGCTGGRCAPAMLECDGARPDGKLQRHGRRV